MENRHGCLVLCGFMGCGKSTVGRSLAELLHWDFLDLDAFIESTAGRTIPEIFTAEGEESFRRMESAALRELSPRGALVLAAGGGALLRAENVEAVRTAGGRIAFLDCPFPVCHARIRNSDRPIVRRSTLAELEALYNARLPIYAAACDFRVRSDTPPNVVARAVRAALEE